MTTIPVIYEALAAILLPVPIKFIVIPRTTSETPRIISTKPSLLSIKKIYTSKFKKLVCLIIKRVILSMSKKVRDVMTYGVIAVNFSTPVTQVIKKLVKENISGLVVVDNAGDMIGVISALDVFKIMNEGDKSWEFVAEDIMTPFTISITPDVDIEEAARMMLQHDIHRLIVTESPSRKKPIGIISSTDILREFGRMV
jgi:predicted transcriptional regulator